MEDLTGQRVAVPAAEWGRSGSAFWGTVVEIGLDVKGGECAGIKLDSGPLFHWPSSLVRQWLKSHSLAPDPKRPKLSPVTNVAGAGYQTTLSARALTTEPTALQRGLDDIFGVATRQAATQHMSSPREGHGYQQPIAACKGQPGAVAPLGKSPAMRKGPGQPAQVGLRSSGGAGSGCAGSSAGGGPLAPAASTAAPGRRATSSSSTATAERHLPSCAVQATNQGHGMHAPNGRHAAAAAAAAAPSGPGGGNGVSTQEGAPPQKACTSGNTAAAHVSRVVKIEPDVGTTAKETAGATNSTAATTRGVAGVAASGNGGPSARPDAAVAAAVPLSGSSGDVDRLDAVAVDKDKVPPPAPQQPVACTAVAGGHAAAEGSGGGGAKGPAKRPHAAAANVRGADANPGAPMHAATSASLPPPPPRGQPGPGRPPPGSSRRSVQQPHVAPNAGRVPGGEAAAAAAIAGAAGGGALPANSPPAQPITTGAAALAAGIPLGRFFYFGA
ncbi:hypothetical protein Agub_g10590 [Astrephomene gubernaculifera]|uniref:Uncharacterized protein n=1 Tax=Astrephomene gubernaculifera TaxID=47775 RepID=A0AAD3HP97_9CHLO|nr:hypothetical protein Agub_g10590 [Astrephomene gubernaculifera]